MWYPDEIWKYKEVRKIKQRTDTSISISLPIVERERWKEYAEKANMSLSAFVRRGINVYLLMLDKKSGK